MTNICDIKNLTASYTQNGQEIKVLDGVNFSIEAGQTFVLLGESGSGKSMTALSLIRLLPSAIQIKSGEITFDNIQLFNISERQMRSIRGAKIGMIFQEPQTSLNPVLTVGKQISETLIRHERLSKKLALQRSIELMEQMGIPDASRRIHDYPHQFSGGMKQRIMIAIALAGKPDLLIADEPTTALDVTTQAQVLSLLKDIQKEHDMAILFVTHDLAIAAQMGTHIAVMRDGQIVESKPTKALFENPEHDYTLRLFDAIPSWKKRVEEDRASEYVDRSDHSTCLLNVSQLKLYYPIRSGLFKRTVGYVRAIDEVSFQVHAGETVAIVGESGSGKTTMGKGILKLIPSTAGEINFKGEDWVRLSGSMLRKKRRSLQIVFQDPYASMNPRMIVRDILQEGMRAQNIGDTQKERDLWTITLLEQVGLSAAHQYRYPHEFSGGQRQRLCIARALAVKPKLIICDEPTSALDVCVQAQILTLLRQLQKTYQLSYLFITHNIGVVEYIAHYVVVMYQGKIAEQGTVEQVIHNPQHEYTKRLLSAVPRLA